MLGLFSRLFSSKVTPRTRNNKVTLGFETFESRITPAVAAAFSGNILTLTNTTANDTATFAVSGANLRITTTAAITAGAGFTQINATTVDLNGAINTATGANSVQKVILNAPTGALSTANIITMSNAGQLPAISEINYTQPTANGAVNLNYSTLTKAIYMTVSVGGTNTFTVAPNAVSIVKFSPLSANSAMTIVTTGLSATGGVGLDFRNAIAAPGRGVQVNLGVSSNIGGYTTGALTQTISSSDATKITGVYGSIGDDTLIGNDQDNLLIGNLGSDILIGNGGNDQLNATRDFAPGIAGAPTVAGGAVTVSATTITDLTVLADAKAKFATLQGTSTGGLTANTLYAKFAFFNFSEGSAFLNNKAGANTDAGYSAAGNNDFTAANAIAPGTTTQDFLYGGDGNDGIYGFNGALVTGYGQAGNDVFSTNTLGVAGTFDGGEGDDLLIGAVGFTLQGGAGNDNLSFVDDPNNPTLTYAIGGAGNDVITAAKRFITIDAAEGSDVVTAANDSTVIIIFNDLIQMPTTPPQNLPLTQMVQR